MLVITEVAHLIGTRLGADAEVRFLGDLAAGESTIEAVTASDWLRIAELVRRYWDLPLGTVDGSSWQRPNASKSPRSPHSTAGTSPSFAHTDTLEPILRFAIRRSPA